VKNFSVSLAFVEHEVQIVAAETQEEALVIARKMLDEGKWEGHVTNSERIESEDMVFPCEQTTRKEYRVHGCKEEYDKVEHGRMYTHIERVDNSIAEFWGVYEVQDDGTEEWIADFRDQANAEMFALEKEKEEL